MTTPTPAEIIACYIKYRDFIDLKNKEHEAAMKPYQDAMQTLEGLMAQHMQETGVDSVKADGIGTAFHKTSTRVRVADRGAFNEFVKAHGDLSWFTNAVSKELVVDYSKEHNARPPGVDLTRFVEVQFRRA